MECYDECYDECYIFAVPRFGAEDFPACCYNCYEYCDECRDRSTEPAERPRGMRKKIEKSAEVFPKAFFALK